MKHGHITSGLVALLLVWASLVILMVTSCQDESQSAFSAEPASCSSPEAASGDEQPQIEFFTIAPEGGHVGDWFVFSWATTGAERVRIEPSITEFELPLTGSVAGQVNWSCWYTLRAEGGGRATTARVWAQVSNPEGSTWGYPLADTSNSAHSSCPGPLTANLKWTFPIPHKTGYDGFLNLGADDSIYLSTDIYNSYRDDEFMIVLNPDGTLKFNRFASINRQVIGPAGVIYGTGTKTKQLTALNPDGSIRWENFLYAGHINECYRRIYINQQGELFVYDWLDLGYESGYVLYIITADGEVEYKYLNPGLGINGIALNCDDSIIYTSSSRLTCMNYQLEQIWTADGQDFGLEGNSFGFAGTPVTDQNCWIYCTFYQSNNGVNETGLMALDILGHEIWRVYYPDAAWRVSAIARSDTAIYVLAEAEAGQDGMYLCAIHLGGWLLWYVPLKGLYYNAEVVVDGADRLFVSSPEELISFDRDGHKRWQLYYPGEFLHSLTLSRNGTLYVLGNNQVYAFGAD